MRGIGVFKPLKIVTYQYPFWVHFRYRLQLMPSIRAGVLQRTRHMHVAAAVASAGRNIHAIGVGSKMVAGKPTGDLCIRIYVIQKLPKSLIAPHFHLPEMLDGLTTDIVESSPTVLLAARRGSAITSNGPADEGESPFSSSAHRMGEEAGEQRTDSTNDCSPDNLTSVQRPLFGGISAANADVLAGTLGCFCRSTRQTDHPEAQYILSNRHILGKIDGEPDDNVILQPSMGDGGTSDKWVARYTRGAELDLSPGAGNKVDAAIAEIRSNIGVKLEVCGIGSLGNPVTVAAGDVVRKCGKFTGLTKGVVRDISFNTHVPLEFDPQGRSLYLVEQIRIEPVDHHAFVGPGDSGSMIVAGASNGVIGLLCGGDPDAGWAVANRIQTVMETLQIAML